MKVRLLKKSKTPDVKNADPDAEGELIQALIPLLGRLAFPPEQLQGIVMRSKRNPLDYVKAYNLCDGKHTMSEIATAIKVTPGTLSPIITEWKDKGIVYEMTGKNGKFYKRLYRLDLPKETKKSKVHKAVDEKPAGTDKEQEQLIPTEQPSMSAEQK